MKPDFALTLSFEGISLLRRVPGGWARLGEVALDDPDLPGALARLRARADALSERGGEVKLILPNEQIKYLSLEDDGARSDALQDRIKAALDGTTPYAVSDLSFDWEVAGGKVHVAAVANETLDEAEAFAKGHHFEPVCFAARAPEGSFAGEVFFGAAASWSGPAPERDAAALKEVEAPPETEARGATGNETAPAPESGQPPASPDGGQPPASPQGRAAEGEGAARAETDAPGAEAGRRAPEAEKADPDISRNEARKAEDEAGDETDAVARQFVDRADAASRKAALTATAAPPPRLAVAADAPPVPEPGGDAAPGNAPEDRPAEPDAPDRTDGAREGAAPAFTSIRASREAPARAPGVTPTAPRPSEAAPRRMSLGGARKAARDIAAPGLQLDPDGAPDEKTPRKGFNFFSRRKNATTTAPPEPPAPAARPPQPESGAGTVTQPGPTRHDSSPARAAVARIAAMRAERRTGKPTPPATGHAGSGDAAIEDERQRMTVFGARSESRIGGKPRFLGLMLTAALLVFLLAVAAWASVFLDDGLARFFRSSEAPRAVARLPEIERRALGGEARDETGPTQAGEASDLRIAALETGTIDDADAPAPLTPVTPPEALTPEEAASRYAATGIWQRAPSAPLEPPMTTLDDLYVASIDRGVQQFDAVALPDAGALRNDEMYLTPPNPAAAGTRFALDPRGLVIATPEGAVNPDGVRVFAGRPPVVPPPRPEDAALPADPVEDAVADALRDRLRGMRPKARPADIMEGNERALLGGRTRAELAALRPVARPASLKEAEETAQPDATKLAVISSSKPITRPRNFARIVERARAARPEVTQVAAVAPRTVQPRIPSTANVAKQATVKNAINLRRINLIGVYGKPSSRRALVRLSNGRYRKVKVGDRLDGGRVAAIGNSELRYTKNGRNIVLDMPN